MMNILTTGLTGLVGSRIQEVLKNKCTFEDFRGNNRVEIQDKESVLNRFKESTAPYVLHLAAKANVDECEKDKIEIEKLTNNEIKENKLNLTAIDSVEWKNSSSAFAVNVIGTKNIAEAAKATGKKLIYISTDYVFPGNTTDAYTEESQPDPINYYGLTKYWGEQVVQAIYPETIIVRIAVPYGSNFQSERRIDVVRLIKEKLAKGETVRGVDNQLITPTFIDDIAHSIKLLFEKNISGIVHVVGSSSLSPYETALAIADIFNYDRHLVKPIHMKDFYLNRAPRPQYTKMNNNKLRNLGYNPLSFVEGLKKLHKQ